MRKKDKIALGPYHGPSQAEWENLIESLATNCGDIAIEFDCGDCCKKVSNGERLIVIVSLGVVVLLPDHDKLLHIKLFGDEGIIERQKADAIVIPIDHICSIEFGAKEID